VRVGRLSISSIVLLMCAIAPTGAHAADTSLVADGRGLGLEWVLPFAGLLLSIAILPLIAPSFWHHHYGKVAAAWAAAFLLPFGWQFGWSEAWHEFVHVIVADYVPFIVLLAALYIAAGGVRLKGALSGAPLANTLFLAFGMVLASVVGTTGACMLLVKPLLRANAWRARTTHTWVFFIFLVGNIGGALTPLGDPPLYIGFLHGVGFFWPTVHLALPMALTGGTLLAVYCLIDVMALRREEEGAQQDAVWEGIEGARNIGILAAIAGAVLATGFWSSGVTLPILGVPVALESAVRTLLIAGLAALAWFWTDPSVRRYNEFRWAPIEEVAKLFAAIFVCIVPALAIIGAGERGAAAPLLTLLNDAGTPHNSMYFWITGLLSSLLDNAPTYLLFFNLAGGDSAILQTTLSQTLGAISAGAVFMGALTYIGNAPNFMVRSIVAAHGRKMPSFFGYMAWSGAFLLPLFVLVGLVFF
jgi:Na+/H+ antiporter NhaD/arsenite permease-like protein